MSNELERAKTEDQKRIVTEQLIPNNDFSDEIRRLEEELALTPSFGRRRPLNERFYIISRSFRNKLPRRKSYTEKLVDKLSQHPDITAEDRAALLDEPKRLDLSAKEAAFLRKLVVLREKQGRHLDAAKILNILENYENGSSLEAEDLLKPQKSAKYLRSQREIMKGWFQDWPRFADNVGGYVMGGMFTVVGSGIGVAEVAMIISYSQYLNIEFISQNVASSAMWGLTGLCAACAAVGINFAGIVMMRDE